ncbi:hypothetical protein HQ560_12670, partial [bacterium]|nr:hypothetical protein [bacterium]
MRVALPVLLSLCLAAGAADAPLDVAERLLSTADRGALTDAQAATAATLLDHPDPFVRGIAEWAITTKVQLENAGQRLRWPREDLPPWYVVWQRLAPAFLLEADYVRQATGWRIHRNPASARGSVAKIHRRARGAASQAPAHRQALVAGHMARLQAIQAKMAGLRPDDAAGHRALWLAARKAARPIALANRAVDFDHVAFIVRHSAHSHRNITGSQYPWVHKPGGDILIKFGLHPDAPCRPVIGGKLGPGHVHGMDLWWDGDRFCFAWARQDEWPPPHDTEQGNSVFLLRGKQEPTHIYTIGAGGTGLQQVTRDRYWSDFEPTWLANGDIAFASDRSGRSSECGKFTADHTVINLYAAAPDGSRLRRLSDNKDIDRYPHTLDNGLIAYTRWDYQERHFMEVHAVWTVRPDGSQSD